MEKVLKLYFYVDGVNDTPFPNEDEQVVITSFTYSASRMGGAPSITATVNHRLCLDDYWRDTVYAEFNGARYFIMNTPTSTKSNDDTRYEHEVELLSEIEILNHVYFIDAVQGDSSSDGYKSNSTDVIFYGDIEQFVSRLNSSLSYSGLSEYSAVIDEGISSDEDQVSFSDKYILEALQEVYDIFEVPYYFVGKVIHFGYTPNTITHVFKYGSDESLLSVSKENANYQVINRITGYGSSDNLPYYYPNETSEGGVGLVAGSGNDSLSVSDFTITDRDLLVTKMEAETPLTYYATPAGISAVGYSMLNTDEYDYTDGQEIEITSRDTQATDPYVLFHYSVSINDASTITSFSLGLYIDGEQIVNSLSSYIDSAYLYDESSEVGYYDYTLSDDCIITFNELPPKGSYSFYIKINIQYRGTNSFMLSFSATSYYTRSWVYDGEMVELSDFGLSLSDSASPSSGDYVYLSTTSYITPVDNLMPPIYRDSGGSSRFYNAENGTYPIPDDDDGAYYEFENEYSVKNPREGIVEFSEIKPTIEGITNAAGDRIDTFIEFAYDENDSDEIDEEEDEYVHPYFFAKMRKTDGEYGFNLFSQALEDDTMQVSFTSGILGACTFEIGVDEDSQKNTVQVDENGDLVRDSDGNVVTSGQAQDRQNDTRYYEVWLALKKDASTYPQVMPNATSGYRPGMEDTFVLLNINLPQAYITAAEDRLEQSLIKYMWENNKEKFTFSITFSRIFLAQNPDVLLQLNENARIIVEYNGKQNTFYISDYTYTMSDGDVLPEITAELSDTLSVGQNSLDTALDSIKEDILTTVGGSDFLKQGLKYFIRKDVADTASGKITFKKGIQNYDVARFGEFVDSLLAGKGVGIDDDGRIQADRVEIRGALVALELIINEIHAMAGDYSFTDAGMIESVDVVDEASGTYKLYIRKDTDSDYTSLDTDDIIYSIINNLKTGGSDYYTSWMRVLSTNVNENSLTVVLYPDSEVPGGTNYPPVAGYNVTRRGNAVMPDTGEDANERAQSWLLSSREGRIMFLQNVYKPILEDYNYALTIGKLPDLSSLSQLPVSTDDVGIVAQTIIAENFYQFDYNGDVIPKRVSRGSWSLEVAQSDSPYRYVSYTSSQPDGSTVTLLEQHTVEHYGCTWGCLIDKTLEEPQWNSTGWVMLEGDPNYYLYFNLPTDYTVRVGNVSIDLEAWVKYGNRDITDVLMAATGTEVEWIRDTGDTASDNSWSPQYVDGQENVIHIDNSDEHGVGTGFGYSYRQLSFTCRVYVPVGSGTSELLAENTLNIV